MRSLTVLKCQVLDTTSTTEYYYSVLMMLHPGYLPAFAEGNRCSEAMRST